MNRLCGFLGVAVLIFVPSGHDVLGAEPFRYQVGKHGQGELKYINDIPVLLLAGTPKEMGEQTGVLAARQAKPLYRFPRDYFLGECTTELLRTNPTWTKQSRGFRFALIAAEATLWPAVQKTAARLEKNLTDAHRSELSAIAEAAGMDVVGPFQLTAANGLFDLGHIPQSELLRGCSSLIVPAEYSATKELLFARNLDFPHFGYLHHYSLLTVYRSSDSQKRSFVSAGFPGFAGCVTGMNDAGLTIASHEVQDPETPTLFNPKGVPFPFAYRRIMEECATIGDAIKLLDSIERASVTSLVIADPSGGAVIEVTPEALVVRRFKEKPGVCTNHFRTMKKPKQVERYDTFKRFDTLTKSLEVKHGTTLRWSVDDLRQRLHEVRMSDEHKENMTIQSFVFEPATRTVHVRFSKGAEASTAEALRSLDMKVLWGKKKETSR